MAEEKLFTLRQISQDLNLPESTIRYYRDSFSRFLPTVGTGRRRRYPARAAAIIRQISEAYATNRPRSEIEATLSAAQAESIGAESVESFNVEHETADEPVSRYLESGRDRRDATWQMAREIVRLSETIDRQGAILGELAKQLADQANRTLPGNTPEPPPSISAQPAPSPSVPAAPSADDAGTEDELADLREQLARERELVERLRRSKVEIERRAAHAESRLGYTPEPPVPRGARTSIFTRFFNNG